MKNVKQFARVNRPRSGRRHAVDHPDRFGRLPSPDPVGGVPAVDRAHTVDAHCGPPGFATDHTFRAKL